MAALTAFYNNFDPRGSQFNYMNAENAIHCSFGDSAHLFGSPGMSWCGSAGATSFFALDHAAILNGLGAVEYPTEEELLLGGDASEFLQQLNGHQKTLEMVADERYSFEHQELDQFGNEVHYQQPRLFEEQLHLSDSPQMCASDESGLTTQDVVTAAVESEYFDEVEVKHEPPPLNNKRLERIEDPDESIEAAEVSVDLIQNRRPFHCGLAGCKKTFKNPQTMKMHHKTHYTDGSAVDGFLPILTASSNAFHNSNASSSNDNNGNKTGQNKKMPSRCPKCRKTFVGLYELRRHYGRKHSEGEKPFGCRKCNKKFYIEVDVRDHEKLCGESMECKCGLKFAFKCNLVAHKKAHPECQPELPHHSHHRSRFSTISSKTSKTSKSSKSSRSSTTSVGESSCKRRRVDVDFSHSESDSITSHFLAEYAAPAPDFQWLPEAKAPRYEFPAAELEFASDDGWSGLGHNMHYSSAVVDFVNLLTPFPCFSGLERLGGQSQSFQPRKATPSMDLLHHLHPQKFSALHGSPMAPLN